jgi:tetrahydromethanopterin S-methyltransferase subunit A
MTPSWPVIDGSFVVGEPDAPVAVCTLTTERLPERLARVPGVAIAGQVYTANLGIERIILNVTANPSIRFLVLCGKESKLFRPGQSLNALIEDGIDGERRIVGAQGYDPVLPEVSESRVLAFRHQVELVDWTGEDDVDALQEHIASLAARSPGRFESAEVIPSADDAQPALAASFRPIRPGGRREPLQYDPKGYFVISLDRDEEQIVLRHYLPDHTAAHEMRGRVAESMLLGLLREGLVSQLSHAAYLGAELAKAEAALHLELRYRQDRPLQAMAQPSGESDGSAEPATAPAGPMPRISPPLTLAQLRAAREGDTVDVVLEATGQPIPGELVGTALEPNEKAPFNSFHRTDEQIAVHWTDQTAIVMGERADVVVGGIFRAHGALRSQTLIDASRIVVLTKVAAIE